jgi:hypothetical protein
MSTGLYIHVSKPAGTIVAAPMYNNAHFNHLFNDVPTSAGAHSDTVTQMRAVTDPAPAGVATPVADLGTEIEQLRFVIADIKTSLNGGVPPTWWYTPISPSATTVTAHGARVFRGSAQSIANDNAQHAASFDTVRYDTGVISPAVDPFFNLASPTRLTAPVTGVYQINGFGEWNTTFSAGILALMIRLNGTKVLASQCLEPDGGSAFRWQTVSTQYLLNQSDYVELVAFQSVASPLNLINPEFGIELIGASQAIPPVPPVPGFFVIQNNAAFVVNNTTVPFIALTNPQPGTNQTVAARMQIRMPSGCKLTAMQVKLSAPLGGVAGAVAIHPVVNGVAQPALQVSIANGGSTGNGAGTVTLNQDDFVYLETVFTGDATTASVQSITLGYTVVP